MCVFSFEDGMTALSWYAWLAFRSRVSMSAIGSVIVMVCGASLAAVPHALGLGDLALGLSAISGASVRPGQWVPGPVVRSSRRNSPAGLAHARELPDVSHLPEADPAQAELAEDGVGATAPLAAGVPTDRELRLAGRLVDQSLLGHGCLLPAQRMVVTTGWPAKGKPSWRSSSRPSSSFVAVVTRVMSMPRCRSILSTSISRNIDCSLRPNV